MLLKVNAAFVGGMSLLFYCLFLFPVCLWWSGQGFSVVVEWEVFSVGSTMFSFPVMFDYVSLVFSLVVCYITSMVLFYSVGYMSGDIFLGRFIWLVLFFVFSMNFLLFVPSVWGVMLGWDGLGITSFALVIYYQSSKSLGAGMITALMNRVGDVLLILSICFLAYGGHWSICYLWGPKTILGHAGGCVIMAGMTKSAQIPFSSWLPAAMAAPTPVSALVHSSTLVTAGVFLLFRFSGVLGIFSCLQSVVMFLSMCTLLMAGLGANFEMDLKKIIALSTLSQLGMMMLSLSLGLYGFAFFHLLTHALLKALLFMCAGAMIHENQGNQDVRSLGEMGQRLPVTVSCFNSANLALCGMPFVGAFYSKDLILEGFLGGGVSWVVLLLMFLATGFTVSYSFRLSYLVCWGSNHGSVFHSCGGDSGEMSYPMLGLVGGAIVGGSLLQSSFLEFDELVFLPDSLKVLVAGVLSLSLLTSLVVVSSQSVVSHGRGVFSWFSHFASSMWFLSWLGAHPLSSAGLACSQYFSKYLDQGWTEVVGGQGAYSTVSGLSVQHQKWQGRLITHSIGLSFWVLVPFLFLFGVGYFSGFLYPGVRVLGVGLLTWMRRDAASGWGCLSWDRSIEFLFFVFFGWRWAGLA